VFSLPPRLRRELERDVPAKARHAASGVRPAALGVWFPTDDGQGPVPEMHRGRQVTGAALCFGGNPALQAPACPGRTSGPRWTERSRRRRSNAGWKSSGTSRACG